MLRHLDLSNVVLLEVELLGQPLISAGSVTPAMYTAIPAARNDLAHEAAIAFISFMCSPYESGLTLGEILHQVGEVEEERGER